MSSLDTWISENIPDVVMDDAAAWLARLDSEHCNEADRLGFAIWLGEDPTHRWAFEELSEVWARLRTLNDAVDAADNDKVVPFPVRERRESLPLPAKTGPSSDWSTLVACAVVGLAVWVHALVSPDRQEWRTGASETRLIELDDGSRIELDARSVVQAGINDRRRSIELLRGVAVFDVAEDDRPFVVTTPHGTVAALGTQFVVDSGDDSMEVAVLDGLVAVNATSVEEALTGFEEDLLKPQNRQRTQLSAGQVAIVDSRAVRSQDLPDETIQKRLAWRNGSAWFDDVPLADALDQMRRYTDLNVHIGEPALDDVKVSGEFPTRDIDVFFQYLAESHDVSADFRDQKLVILRNSETSR